MTPLEAIDAMKLRKRITSDQCYGHYYMLPNTNNTIFYTCKDSGCTLCQNEYSVQKFLELNDCFTIQ